jgi:hypothetical protein
MRRSEGRDRRYGRAVRLGKNPTHPKTRINYLGEVAHRLLRYVRYYLKPLYSGPQIQALRQIFLQSYWTDERGQLRWRTPEQGACALGGRDRLSVRPVRPLRAARADPGEGFRAHVTETCDEDAVNVITDVATTKATVRDTRALTGIHARLDQRGLLPAERLVDGGHTSVALRYRVARDHQVKLVGPVQPKVTRKPRKAASSPATRSRSTGSTTRSPVWPGTPPATGRPRSRSRRTSQ